MDSSAESAMNQMMDGTRQEIAMLRHVMGHPYISEYKQQAPVYSYVSGSPRVYIQTERRRPTSSIHPVSQSFHHCATLARQSIAEVRLMVVVVVHRLGSNNSNPISDSVLMTGGGNRSWPSSQKRGLGKVQYPYQSRINNIIIAFHYY